MWRLNKQKDCNRKEAVSKVLFQAEPQRSLRIKFAFDKALLYTKDKLLLC